MTAAERLDAEQASPAHAVQLALDALDDADRALTRATSARDVALYAYYDALDAGGAIA